MIVEGGEVCFWSYEEQFFNEFYDVFYQIFIIGVVLKGWKFVGGVGKGGKGGKGKNCVLFLLLVFDSGEVWEWIVMIFNINRLGQFFSREIEVVEVK